MTRGSCLCGAVTWQAAGPFDRMVHCHCSMCRKAHGAAFATFAATPASGFEWRAGEERITRYESSESLSRPFCSTCGSVVPVAGGDPVFVPAGCLDDDPGVRPQAHIFAASRAPWHEIRDALPQFAAYPPGIPEPKLHPRPRAPRPTRPGVVRGSCLCAAVRYELEGELRGIVHCHCSRCRKARGAAHASNLFAAAAALRFVCGQDRIESFEVPDAERFTASFCRVCGSPLPRLLGGQPIVGIPAGSLDDDPGARERMHIYCGSRAPWFEIDDDLPRFEEGPPARR
ncbi:MAG: GFA family protein [Myxococcota bacterium]